MADPQTTDPVAAALLKLPLTSGQRADAWDAFHQSADGDALTAKLQTMNLPQTAKAALWDLKQGPVTPDFKSENAKDAAGNPIVDFASHFGSQINPIPLGQLLPFPKSLGGAGFDAPVQAAKNILQAQSAVKAKGDAAWQKGDHIEAIGHYIDWLLPVIGPVVDKAGDELRSGRTAAGMGDTLGLATTLFGPHGAQAFKDSAAASKLADAAERGAQSRAVETMAPQVGPNKVRFGNMAADVGSQVLKDTTAHTRAGMLDQAATHLDNSYAALDAAYDKVPDTRPYLTAPLVQGLQREISKLSVSGSAGAVEPATRASRIASLRQAIDEVKALGPTTNIDNLRKLQGAWGEGAKAVFTPSMAQDFLKARNAGSGWADARSVASDYLVSQHPELAPLNADASLWKKAVDVMQAAEEADRVRPKVGRTIMARGLGAAAGGETGGGWGAAAGAVVGPMIERTISNLTPAAKILAGRQMANLAEALRAGQPARVSSLIGSLKTMLKPAAVKVAQVATGATGPVWPPALAAGNQP